MRRASAALAGRQHGMIAWRQLRVIGVSGSTIARLSAGAWLYEVHYGVYHVGHDAPTRLGMHAAATLAFGKRTAVSHRPATVLGGLLPDRGGSD